MYSVSCILYMVHIGADCLLDVWVKSFHVLFKYPSDIHFRILCFHSNHKIQPLAMGMLAHVMIHQQAPSCVLYNAQSVVTDFRLAQLQNEFMFTFHRAISRQNKTQHNSD